MSHQTGIALGFFPLLVLPLALGIGVLLALKLGWRRTLIFAAGLFGLAVLLFGGALLFHARPVPVAVMHRNTYPTLVSPSNSSSQHEYLQHAEEMNRYYAAVEESRRRAERSMSEARQNIARQQAHITRQLSQLRDQAQPLVQVGPGNIRVENSDSLVRISPDGIEVNAPDQVLPAEPEVWSDPASDAIVDLAVMTNDELRSAEPWRSVADLEFAADVHPSAASAAEALLVQVLKLKDATKPDATIRRLQVWAEDRLDGEVVSRVLDRLHRKAPDWMVMVEAMQPGRPLETADPEGATLRLDVPSYSINARAPWDLNRPEKGGVLRMRLSFKGGSIDRSTRFIEKPWVQNTSEFISSRPQMRWVVGFSSPGAADRTKARQEAIRAAASQVLPDARKRLSSRMAFDDRWLFSRIERELTNMNDVKDRFVQTMITNSGGQVVREAILVQSPPLLGRVEQQCLSRMNQQRRTWLATAVSAVGLLLLVCVVGTILNSLTKGYYRKRLVAIGLVAVVLGPMAVLLAYRSAARSEAEVALRMRMLEQERAARAASLAAQEEARLSEEPSPDRLAAEAAAVPGSSFGRPLEKGDAGGAVRRSNSTAPADF